MAYDWRSDEQKLNDLDRDIMRNPSMMLSLGMDWPGRDEFPDELWKKMYRWGRSGR